MSERLGYRRGDNPSRLVDCEWLVTNGVGGYASGTLSGALTRRFHGLLVSAMPGPLGRVMMLNHLSETLVLPSGERISLSLDDHGSAERGLPALREVRLESGLPVWTFEVGGHVIERRVFLPHQQNTTFVQYRVVTGEGPVELVLRPSVNFRPHEGGLDQGLAQYAVRACGTRWELVGDERYPALRLRPLGRAELVLDGGSVKSSGYEIERDRGYDYEGPVFSPGFIRFVLDGRSRETALVVSTEPWETIEALGAEEALAAEHERRRRLLRSARPELQRGNLGPDLVLAADQFVITPQTRPADAARAHARGDEARTVIAGYHWFTDWGRDTMIALEGLTLVTGRTREAACILRTFAHHVKDGLIPNLFPEGSNSGLYHTADATLWFVHAIERYVAATGDVDTRRSFMPTLRNILERHVQGTRFGIRVDPADGLLSQGEAGVQLTWMDAKVDDWVVTPRRGKAVEINALFYNALRLIEGWAGDDGDGQLVRAAGELADRNRASFNARFWCDRAGHLYDVVDGESGDDASLRPNQLLAMSLTHPVLDPSRWRAVVDVVTRELLTPVGLRSLSPRASDYRARYDGDLRSRDAAYHQGTVWVWLVGPYVDAWLRVHPHDVGGAARVLEGIESHAHEACLGSVSEIFDGEAPYQPRGCVAQAWSVAELLRALSRLARVTEHG